jgi:BlaI family penicillinase repressor
MKTPEPQISDTEWEIMRIVWKRHPVTAADIIAALTSEDATWHPKTARTLLNRLVQKKALGYERSGRVYQYIPLVKEEDCIALQSESFLERVFGGSFTPLLAHFVKRQRLKPAELDELRSILAADRTPTPKPRSKK